MRYSKFSPRSLKVITILRFIDAAIKLEVIIDFALIGFSRFTDRFIINLDQYYYSAIFISILLCSSYR